MSILSDQAKSTLVGRLLGIPQGNPAVSNVPERVAPSGTVRGTEPSLLASFQANPTYLALGAVVVLVGVLYLLRK